MKKLLGFIMIFSIIMGVFALNSNAMTNGGITYTGKDISVKKSYSATVTVEVLSESENAEVKWTSNSPYIFEFLGTTGEYNETVTIKGRIKGNATLTASLYIDGVLVDVENISVEVTGSYISGGTNDPPSPDEVLYGTVIDFDSIDGDFGTTENYVKILNSNGEELIYELSSKVYFEEQLYTSDDVMWILKNIDRNINYVVRSGKIKYINLHMPEGIFESVEIESCYKANNKIFVRVTFDALVGECTCIAAAYNKEGAMCSAASFEASYNDSYSYDVELEANDGEYVKVFFLDNAQSLKPVCEAKIAYIPTEYGYLLSVNKTDGEYEFEIFTDDGTIETLECAEKIVIDEEAFVDGDSRVSDRLEFSAKSANKAYEDEVNVTSHQPVMYKTNKNGEIAHIDTVVSSVNEKISILVNGGEGYAEYGYKQFKMSTRAFEDFKVNSDTKIIFVPDDRSDTDSYVAYSSYKDAFINTKSYHVEAYGLSATKTASLVLIYKENDRLVYKYNSPMMIVESKISAADGVYIEGFSGTSYTPKRVKVNTEEVQSLAEIGRGDVIRYLTDSSSEMIDYTVWYDADNAVQGEPCDDIDSAIAKRILEINATSVDPVVNCPNASFRLQYGTVSEILFEEEGDMIWVTPTIVSDNIEPVTDGNGFVGWEIDNSVKVYKYENGKVTPQADLKEITQNETKVIAYSSYGKLKMIYIIP